MKKVLGGIIIGIALVAICMEPNAAPLNIMAIALGIKYTMDPSSNG